MKEQLTNWITDNCFNNSLSQEKNYQYPTYNEIGSPPYSVKFSGLSEKYCVGFVDIVNSTKISANMDVIDWAKYYEGFLNSMAKILHSFGGIAIKNCGDSLFYYFAEAPEQKNGFGFRSCLDCSLAMIGAQKLISEDFQKEGLPALNYRVSADYGKVAIMKSTNISGTDLFGPPVNVCAKINYKAEKNEAVIGGDLYRFVKKFEGYHFKEKQAISVGAKNMYHVYSAEKYVATE